MSVPNITRLARALPLAVAAGLIAYALVASSGARGALLLALIAVLAAALAAWTRNQEASVAEVVRRTASAAVTIAPAALLVFFSFSAGGFFPDSVAIGDLVVGCLLVARLAMAADPLAAFGRAAMVPLLGLVGLTALALASQLWSHAPGRAAVGFDRDLLYLLTFALFASLGQTRERLGLAVRAVAIAMTAVAALALLSRVAPSVLATSAEPASSGRLAYPLTYWNALGIFCAVAVVLCLHLAADDERPAARVLAAGATPIIAATLLLTYSRGALAAAAIGVVLYAVLGRPRALLPALVAIAPAIAVTMKVAYDDTLLSSGNPTTAAALHQGHQLAVVVLACVACAIGLRGALLVLDRRLEGAGSPLDRHRRAVRFGALGAFVLALVVAVALGAPGAIVHRWHEFTHQPTVASGPLVRSRLSSTSANGRVELWTVAWDAFKAHPLDGAGQDTFDILWYEHRNQTTVVVNAHSLYLETLAELGIFGLGFLALFVLGTLGGLLPRHRGRDRPLYGALFAAGVAWAIHAGVDWDWQMPAVSLWFAALGGLALGRGTWRPRTVPMPASVAALIVGAAALAACVLPALVLASQVRLSEATSAYAAADCARANQLARHSVAILPNRAPPWQIEALCAVRAGRYRTAQARLRAGLAEDPNNWQLRAALAATAAAAGSDARTQAAAALRLNPLDPSVQTLANALARGPSRAAREAAIGFLSQQSLVQSG